MSRHGFNILQVRVCEDDKVNVSTGELVLLLGVATGLPRPTSSLLSYVKSAEKPDLPARTTKSIILHLARIIRLPLRLNSPIVYAPTKAVYHSWTERPPRHLSHGHKGNEPHTSDNGLQLCRPDLRLGGSWQSSSDPPLILRSRNIDALKSSGGLRKEWYKIPKVIQQAIIFVRQLQVPDLEPLLWVDALCNIQDDADHKNDQIFCMDAIYGHATVTITAESTRSAHDQILRF